MHERQRAADTLEQALVSKRKFLSMVNHEVTSPLQNIVASAELLAMKEHRPESVAAIRRIQHAVTVLQGQLRDLLTVARGDSGQMPMQAETFDMGDMVRDVCADFEDSAAASRSTLAKSIPASSKAATLLPARAPCSRSQNFGFSLASSEGCPSSLRPADRSARRHRCHGPLQRLRSFLLAIVW